MNLPSRAIGFFGSSVIRTPNSSSPSNIPSDTSLQTTPQDNPLSDPGLPIEFPSSINIESSDTLDFMGVGSISREDLMKINVFSETPAALVPKEDCKKFVEAVAKKFKISTKTAFVGICILCQKGGTAKKAQPNVYANIDGITMTLGKVREVADSCGFKSYTLRQFARTFADEIYQISVIYGIDGDLSKKILRVKNEIQDDFKPWLSNFQMDNMNAPEEVRALLYEHYRHLFDK